MGTQTCRVLHTFACSDYVWHHLSIDLPLDIPPDHPVASLSGPVLQPIVIRALRLDNNWRKREPQLKCSQICSNLESATVMQMQLIGKSYILVLSRWPSYDELSLSSLDEPLKARPYAALKTTPLIQFAAALQTDSSSGTLAFLRSDDAISVYDLSLGGSCDRPCSLSRSIRMPAQGRASVIETCNHIVASIVARIADDFGPPAYSVLFLDTHINTKFLYPVSFETPMSRLQMKLYPTCFTLIGMQGRYLGARDCALVVRMHKMPPSLNANGSYALNQEMLVLPVEECPLIAEYVLSPIPHPCEFYNSLEPVNGHMPYFSLMVFHSFGEHVRGFVDIYRIPIDAIGQGILDYVSKPSHRFRTRTGTRPEIVCIGKTGLRAVWLDYQWETDEFRLWKGTFQIGELAVVSPLVPAHLPLPFELHAISSLSFEEVTGRVCVGLQTGAAYLLAF
ncbi:hypothetical protein AX17_002320 [Amanita inopinata Kibby_2008]|nr:hypothetical protein AX17_002320 [Amanita inopinata Kibby_2008]